MSDYSNPNIHRGDGLKGRGLLIAIAVLVAFVFALAYLGASTVPEGSELGADGVITPAQPTVDTPIVPVDPNPTVAD